MLSADLVIIQIMVAAMSDKAPLYFTVHLGMLKPANREAESTLAQIKGTVRAVLTGGEANQKRRNLYWACAHVVTPILNDLHNLTLTEADLHDITRDKFRMYDEIKLPSGEVLRKRHSTSNRAMNEAARAEYTTRALGLWSKWCGVDVDTLRREGELIR